MIVLMLVLLPRTWGMIHSLVISKDTRRMFQIESFGFREGGYMNLTVSDFTIEGPEPYRAGFVVTKTSTESSAQEELEDALEGGSENGDSIEDGCLLDKAGPTDLVLDISDRSRWGERGTQASRTVGPGEQGLYVLYFCGCPGNVGGGRNLEEAFVSKGEGAGGEGEHSVTFKLRVAFWNNGSGGERDYLSAGMEVLPKLFLGMFGLFFAALLLWVQCLRRHTVHVIKNVAQIVLEETAPGSLVWLKWRNVLHVVDIVCCCSILMPIMWSIKHLRQAALADGKAENTIRRLNVFRHFYKMVLIYVYFTRIVLVLLSAMLPFELKWLEQLSAELATLVFFVLTGWRFRPQPEAPYLPISRDRDEGGIGDHREGQGNMELQALHRESSGT
ncbi:unnamed protein product [Ascophyllum nodosum]